MHIPINLSATSEPKPVVNGVYDLTIATCEEGKSRQQGKPQLVCYVGIDAHPTAPNIRHTISLPAEGDTANSKEFKMLLMKRFLTAFKIPFDANGFDVESFPGAKAKLEVRLGEPNDSGDSYNEIVIPKMKGESESRASVAKPPKR